MNRKIIIIDVVVLIISIIIISVNLLTKNNNKEDSLSVENNNVVQKICDYNNPIVPTGFKKVETESASWQLENGVPKGWNNGLVIEDEIGNQFVWVPLKSIDSYRKIYTITYKMPRDDKDESVQLEKYSGFYVARYEAGVSKEMQNTLTDISEETNDIEGIPVSKNGVRPWNFITKEKAQINSEKMYSNEYVYSSLLTSREWVHINSWLKECGYEVDDPKEYGNFSNVNFKFTGLYSEDIGKTYVYGENKNKETKNMILATGITDRNISNNIYDFFGNIAEGTIFRYEGKDANNKTKIYTSYDVYGGYYDNSSKGESFNYVWANSKVGFRVVLYLK